MIQNTKYNSTIGIVVCAFLAVTIFVGQTNRAFADSTDEEAGQFIQNLANKAISVLRDDSGSLEIRESKFQTLLYDGFALDRLGRFVVGNHWRKMSPEQQDDYQELFKLWVVKTYSVRLGGYTGQIFSIVTVVKAGTTDRYVRTLIDQPKGGGSVRVDWRVRHIDSNFKIVDVVVEGISMVVTQKQEFSAVVRRHGVEGLIETLRARVSKFPAKSG